MADSSTPQDKPEAGTDSHDVSEAQSTPETTPHHEAAPDTPTETIAEPDSDVGAGVESESGQETGGDQPVPPSDTAGKTEVEPGQQDANPTASGTSFVAPKRHTKRKLLFVTAVGIVLLLNAGMAGASLYLRHKTPALSTSTPTAITTTPAAPKSSATSSAADDSATLHYTSAALHIEFDYPVSWRLSASASNNSIDLSSEQFAFNDYAGVKKSGTLHLSISSKDSGGQFGYINPDSPVIGASRSLAYKNPTSVQRKVTNVTFVNSDTYHPEVASAGGADYLLVTGGVSYAKGQTLTQKDYLSTDPQIYAYIESCPEVSCKYLATAATTADIWNTDENLIKAQDLIASIKVTQ